MQQLQDDSNDESIELALERARRHNKEREEHESKKDKDGKDKKKNGIKKTNPQGTPK
jgi:hypothetical protein